MNLFDRYRPHPTNRSMALVTWLALTAWLAVCTANSGQAAITDQQHAKATELAQSILAASKLYADGSYAKSAEKVTSVQQELIELLKSSNVELQRLVKPTYQRLVRAHSLLELEGAELEPLPSWKELTASENAVPDKMSNAAKGTEASFTSDIAPWLINTCGNCHIAKRSGEFSMASFESLMAGANGATVVFPGSARSSRLVDVIESGDMPRGGGKVSAEQLAALKSWIDEGAKFDGPTTDMNIESLINQVQAGSAQHGELFLRRQQDSLQRWTRVLPNDSPSTTKDDELFLLGNVPQERLGSVLEQLQSAVLQTKKLLKTPVDKPLIDGGLTVFVLKSRYDYSEFGRMTENRELPKDWLGHWHADPLDVYGVLAADSDSSDARAADRQAEAVALQIVSGAYLGSFSQVPTWFAEGVARNLVKDSFRRGDARLAVWQHAYPVALLKMDKAQTLLEGRLDEESAGLVGMGLTHFMMERTNRRRFDQLLELLQAGQTFESACTATFAPPETLVSGWLGK
ncbi:MAG: hypothetical protein R3C09_00770 [Pirellulaceae bacterium]